MATIDAALTRRIVTAGCAAVLAALTISGPARAAAAEAPPIQPVTVDVQTVNGTGCPAGSATVHTNSDNTGFHIAYSSFIARAGGAAAPTAFRRNCQVAVSVHIPQGFSLAIARADYTGQFSLASDATALQRTNYYFQGDANNNFVDHTFAGQVTGTWHTIDATASENLVYAPCGQTVVLNVNQELRVYAPTVASWISMRTSDGNADTIIQWSWKQC